MLKRIRMSAIHFPSLIIRMVSHGFLEIRGVSYGKLHDVYYVRIRANVLIWTLLCSTIWKGIQEILYIHFYKIAQVFWIQNPGCLWDNYEVILSRKKIIHDDF